MPDLTAPTIAQLAVRPGNRNSSPSTVVCKASVRLKGLTPALAKILFAIEHVSRTRNILPVADWPKGPLTITSINDSEHMDTSRHYSNEAVDLRSKDFPSDAAKKRFRARFEGCLNARPDGSVRSPAMFAVILENLGTDNEHFHIQVAKGQTYVGID